MPPPPAKVRKRPTIDLGRYTGRGLDDDEERPRRPVYTNDVSRPPSGAPCALARCLRGASKRITFGQTGGTQDYCDQHAWPHTRGANN